MACTMSQVSLLEMGELCRIYAEGSAKEEHELRQFTSSQDAVLRLDVI